MRSSRGPHTDMRLFNEMRSSPERSEINFPIVDPQMNTPSYPCARLSAESNSVKTQYIPFINQRLYMLLARYLNRTRMSKIVHLLWLNTG
jgi:hypothetical protein